MPEDPFQPGEIVRVADAEEEEKPRVMVVETYDERQDEKRIKWDFNKNPIHVYDYDEKNQQYAPDARVVGVVYVDALKDEGYSWARMSPAEVRQEIEAGPLREYHFPVPRLESVDVDGSVAYQ